MSFDHLNFTPLIPHLRSSSSPCILLLNGYPGVGKLTIARALSLHLTLSSTPHRLIDNHLLIDPVIAIEPIRNKSHYALRKAFSQTTFEGLKALKEEVGDLVVIFTSCLAVPRKGKEMVCDDVAQFQEYVDLSKETGLSLAVVNLVCNLGKNREILQSEERKEHVEKGKTKLVDGGVLEKIREETQLLGRENMMRYSKGEVCYFELDTTELVVEEAKEKALEFLVGVEGR